VFDVSMGDESIQCEHPVSSTEELATNSKHVGFRVEHTHRSAKALCFKVFCFKAFNPTKHTFRCATKSVCVMPTIQIVAFEYAAMDKLNKLSI